MTYPRTTDRQLKFLCDCINQETDSPATYAKQDGSGGRKINVGHYYLNFGHKAVCLYRVCGKDGAVTDPLWTGLITRKVLWGRMHSYIEGIKIGKGLTENAIS